MVDGEAGGAKKKVADNIFANFHSAQQASSDSVIAEFKLRMQKKQTSKEQ